MLYYYNRVAAVAQAREYADEFVHVVGVKPRGGLVEDINGFARAALGKLGCKLYPLRLAARKGGCALPQPDIAEPDVAQRFKLVVNGSYGFEERRRLLHSHFQHVGNRLAFILYFKRFAVVPLTAAHLAGDKNIGQEVHCNLQNTVALTVFAPAARYVKRKSSALVPPLLCVLSGGEQVAYHCKHARISRGVTARRSAYRLLVYGYNFIEVLHPLVAFGIAQKLARAVEFVGKVGVNYFVYKA